MADARARSHSPGPEDAKEVVVAGLGGDTWKILLGASESVADLRRKVAKVSGIPQQEVMLSCGAALLSDEQTPLADGGALEGVQLVRMQAPVPTLDQLKKTLAELKQDTRKHKLEPWNEQEWIKIECNDLTLFKGNAMTDDDDWDHRPSRYFSLPSLTVTRYNLSENPDVHIILAKAYIKFSGPWNEGGGPELKEIADFHDTFAELENAEDDITDFYPPDAGKEGCKTYSLVETGETALSAAVSPGWLYIYDSFWS